MRFDPNQFVIFLENIDEYLQKDLIFNDNNQLTYPIGELLGKNGSIKIEFVHYNSQKEAKEKWEERKSRINWNKIFVICTDENMDLEMIHRFDKLSEFPNKILFTNKLLPEIPSTIHVLHNIKENGADLLNFSNPLGKRKYQNYINYVNFLNQKEFIK